MKKVSVIIPIYNTLEYLGECVDSILNQTLSDIEIILINDGSTDGSDKVAEDYADRNGNVILINQENAGLSAARNRGLEAATGNYIYFIDSDDMLEKTALENMYRISEQEQLDILAFAAQTFYDSDSLKKEYGDYDNFYLRKGMYLNPVNGKDLLLALYNNGDYKVSACLQFIRRIFLIENKIRFYEGIVHEDNLFTFEILLKAEKARCLNDTYYYRRIRGNSIMTQKKTAAKLRGYFVCLKEQIRAASKVNCTEEQHRVILSVIKSVANSVRAEYCALDAVERNQFLEACTIEDRFWFEGVFVTYIHELERINCELSNALALGSKGTDMYLLRKAKTGIRVLKNEGKRAFLRLIVEKINAHIVR